MQLRTSASSVSSAKRSLERNIASHANVSVPSAHRRSQASAVQLSGDCTRVRATAGWCGFVAVPSASRGASVVAKFSSSDLSADSYVCLGVSQCFEKVEGRLTPRLVIEPVSASSLECMANGARTSFKLVTGTTMADAVARDLKLLPEGFSEAIFCASFAVRCEAAARTWTRPHAQDNLMDLVPIGKTRTGFNFSLEDKRVLNMENIVNDTDNIKQDISIDVYGRKTAEEAKAAAATGFSKSSAADNKKIKEEEEEDELDKLLTA